MRFAGRFVWLAALAAASLRIAPAQTCAACGPLIMPDTVVSGAVVENANTAILPASSGYGQTTVAVTAAGATPLPANLPAGSYQSWCGTSPKDSVLSANFTATSNPPLGAAVWSEINYILNHKQGTISDVQEAIWAVLGTMSISDLTAQQQTTALAIYNDAAANGMAFTPAPGQRLAVMLEAPAGSGIQSPLVELVNCGSIGDRVWLDSNGNGIQDSGEPGINGVQVKLQDGAGNLLATAVTAPSPVNYPYLAPGTNGWYQFTGLTCSTAYTVSIDTAQPALRGAVPTVAQAGNPAAVTLNITVNPAVDEAVDFGFTGAPPIALVCPINYGYATIPYTSSVPATGGTPAYTFAVSSGSLPPGLTLASNGALSGTPATAAASSFALLVTDSAGASQSIACSILVNPPPVAIGCPASTGQASIPYSSQYSVAGGTPPYRFSLAGGSMPAGLSLDASTGGVSGTPTAAGKFYPKISVQDSTGSSVYTAMRTCGMSIATGPLTLACAAATATKGTAYSSYAAATGGAAPYRFAIASGSLPPGLSLNAGTGLISGTPMQEGSFNFTITLTDAKGATASANCGITVASAFTVNCPATAGATGAPYRSSASVSGGVGPFSFAISSGALAPGLTLNSATGSISGTPTAAGAYAFAVQVTDTSTNPGTVESGSCSITVAISATCPTATTGTVGAPYSSAMTGLGGAAPYTFSNATGLPPGLTISSAGVISGTPTSAGAYSFQVTVTDAAGHTGTASCTLSIHPPISSACVNLTAVQGVAITPATMTASGGAGGPYTFSAVGLPSGLVMSSGGAISGTPTVDGTFNYTVTIMDQSGATATYNCTLTVAAPLAVECASSSGMVGATYNSSVSAHGGVAPYAYFLVAGVLPPGLAMNAGTGAITGIPTTAGAYSFSAGVRDSTGILNATSSCSIGVAPDPAAAPLATGDTATIGFWNNKNGQALILSLNGGATSKALANWLAAQFPSLYGPAGRHDLTNQSNNAVAALFRTFFSASGQKTDAQVMAGALACYVSSSALAGVSAVPYGFNSSPAGTGAKGYDVGSNGAAIGLVNGRTYSICALLQQANLTAQNGTFNAGAFNTIFSNINQTGDIK